jgi:lipopolysaccharide assembly outer membrane protein LptD (OstA)
MMRIYVLTYDITGNELTGKNVRLLAVTDNGTAHGNVTLERGDDIGSRLLLVKGDESVKQQDTTDDTEIDPVTQTNGQQSGDFHD